MPPVINYDMCTGNTFEEKRNLLHDLKMEDIESLEF